MKTHEKILLSSLLLFVAYPAISQKISRSTQSNIADVTCPGSSIQYQVSLPSGFSSCQIKWTATNGEIQSQSGNTVTVKWNDKPAAIAKLEATFNSCASADSGNNGKSATSLSELILSVKDQGWLPYGDVRNLDFCTRQQLVLSVSHMYVQGTGGIDQPPLKEVNYSWTLPSGWRESGTGQTGTILTNLNFMTIEPIGCSVGGTVLIKGVLSGSPYGCDAAAPSSTASISLNAASPSVTVSPPQGYQGSKACDTNPVTFAAFLSPSLSCVNGYSWNYPSSWTFVSQSFGTITLRPSGKTSDVGAIKANVSFTCGTVVSGTYNVSFITPTISGAGLVCASEPYKILNATPNPTVTWSSNNAGLSISTDGVATRVNGYNGGATISASVCGNPATPKSIYVGFPSANNTTLIWAGTRGVNPVQTTPGSTYTFNGDFVLGATDYTWALPNGFVQLGPSTTTCNPSIYITTSSVAGTYYLSCSANNLCGPKYMANLRINNGSTGGGDSNCPPGFKPPCKPGPGPLLMSSGEVSPISISLASLKVYPNPSNKNVTVNFNAEDNDISESDVDSSIEITLYNLMQQIVLRQSINKSVATIPVDGLTPDVYILSIAYKNEVVKRQVVVIK